MGVGDVENELFEAILVRRNECLALAAQSASIQEHDSKIDEARLLLNLIEQDLLDLEKLTASRFGKLYGQVSYWIGFRKNPSDKTLRGYEEALLVKLLSSASQALATELLEVVSPENSYPDFGEGIAEKQALRERCVAILAPKAAREAITFVAKEGGIRALNERGRFSGVKNCLFRSESPLWKTGMRDEILELIRKGRDNFIIYSNVRELFDLLLRGLEHGIDSVGRQGIAKVLSDQEFVQRLWETVTSRGIQYRMQTEFLQARSLLVQNGIPEAALPLTPELQARQQEEKSRAAGNP